MSYRVMLGLLLSLTMDLSGQFAPSTPGTNLFFPIQDTPFVTGLDFPLVVPLPPLTPPFSPMDHPASTNILGSITNAIGVINNNFGTITNPISPINNAFGVITNFFGQITNSTGPIPITNFIPAITNAFGVITNPFGIITTVPFGTITTVPLGTPLFPGTGTVPAPIVITHLSIRSGTLTLQWIGGRAPFLIVSRPGFATGPWSVIALSPAREVTMLIGGNQGFFQVLSAP